MRAVASSVAGPSFADAPDTSAWVVTLGADTLSLEQFTRTGNQVRGELVTRTPRSLHRSYVMDLDPDGCCRRRRFRARSSLRGATRSGSMWSRRSVVCRRSCSERITREVCSRSAAKGACSINRQFGGTYSLWTMPSQTRASVKIGPQ